MRVPRLQLGTAILAITFAAVPAAKAASSTASPDSVPRIIVKLRTSAAEGLDDLARRGRSLDRALGRGELDRLNAQFGVRRIRPLRTPDAALPKVTARRAAERARRSRLPSMQGVAVGEALPSFVSTYVFELQPGVDVDEAARVYGADPVVAYAEPDRLRSLDFLPSDPFLASSDSWNQDFADLWGTHQIAAPAAWDTARGAGIVIAITDTGIDTAHPDIAGNLWTNPGEIAGNGLDDDGNGYVDDIHGWNSTVGTPVVFDGHGHGTHVAGTAAAVGNNGIGIVGVAFESRVMAVKGFTDEGRGFDSDLVEGILYAVENGARVINASWGGDGRSVTLENAIAIAHAADVVFVAAAGNAATDIDSASGFYPAAYRDAIAVAANNHLDAPADFTNFGLKLDVTAPGGGDEGPEFQQPSRSILSLKSSGAGDLMTGSGSLIVDDLYVRQAGTSMAAPHVAGAAAVILSARPDYTVEQVRQALRVGADDVGAAGFDRFSGYGRLNVHGALQVDALAVHISAPENRTPITTSSFDLIGSVDGLDLVAYHVEREYAQQPGVWTTVFGPVSAAVEDGVLATLDVDTWEDGLHTLRLIAESTSGEVFVDQASITLDRVDVTAPADASTFRSTQPIEFRGTIAPPDLLNYVLEYHIMEPPHVPWASALPSAWTSAGVTLSGGGLAPVIDGVLATFDPSVLSAPRKLNFRMRVTKASGIREDAITSLIFDPTLKEGWPRKLDHGLNNDRARLIGKHAPTLVDLDQDGSAEILVAWGIYLHAFRIDGTELPGWPFRYPDVFPFYPSDAGPSVADVDGDGDLEVVTTNGEWLFVLNHDGSVVPGWPRAYLGAFQADCTLADLDRDGASDIIFGTAVQNSWEVPEVHAIRFDGSELPGFPVAPAIDDPGRFDAIAAGDVDGDGSIDLAATWTRFIPNFKARKQRLYVFDAQGNVKRRFPRRLGVNPFPYHRNSDPRNNPAIMADLDGDGILDIAVSNHRVLNKIHAYTGQAKRVPIRFKLPRYDRFERDRSDPVVAADVTGDGIPELFTSTDRFLDCIPDCRQGYDFLSAVTPGREGGMLPNFPISFSFDPFSKLHGPGTPAIGDIDRDGRRDLVLASGLCSDEFFVDVTCHALWALDRDGLVLPGFPKPTQVGSEPFVIPALGDLDDDGTIEIVWLDYSGNLTVWEVPPSPGASGPLDLPWPMARQNPAHTAALPIP